MVSYERAIRRIVYSGKKLGLSMFVKHGLSMDTLDAMCSELKCGLEDLIELVPDDTVLPYKVYMENELDFSPFLSIVEDRGLTLSAVGKATLISPFILYNVRKGGRIGYASLVKLSDFFGVPISELFEVKHD